MAFEGSYRRVVRDGVSELVVRVRRARCTGCDVEHALLPDFLAWRRRYRVDTIGAAAAAAAAALTLPRSRSPLPAPGGVPASRLEPAPRSRWRRSPRRGSQPDDADRIDALAVALRQRDGRRAAVVDPRGTGVGAQGSARSPSPPASLMRLLRARSRRTGPAISPTPPDTLH
jgi:hypothetical protein